MDLPTHEQWENLVSNLQPHEHSNIQRKITGVVLKRNNRQYKNKFFLEILNQSATGPSQVSVTLKLEEFSTPELFSFLRRDIRCGDLVQCEGWLERLKSDSLLAGLVGTELVKLASWASRGNGKQFNAAELGAAVAGPPGKGKESWCKGWVFNGTCTSAHCRARHPEAALRLEFRAAKLEQKYQAGKLQKHSKRAAIFAEWLQQTFSLDQSSRVLDVAGGSGELSFELIVRKAIHSKVVDPRQVKLSKKQLKMLKEHSSLASVSPNLVIPQLLALFDRQTSVEGITLLVGLHPDQATELIVDVALQKGLPFAIVPCCVFSADYPRKLSSGREVISYEDFITYLREKSPAILTAELAITGRNLVLWRA